MIRLRLVRRWSAAPPTDTHGWLWRVDKRLGHEGESVPGSPNVRTTYYLHVFRFVLVTVLLGGVGYGALSLTAWWWYRRQLGHHVAFADVAWPARWPRVRQARINALVQRGFVALNAQRYNEAAQRLTFALRRAPARDDVRVALARVYAGFQAFSRAFEVIDEALPFRTGSPELLHVAIALSFESEDYARALRYTDLALTRARPDDASEQRFARQSRVRALAALHRGADALAAAAALSGETDAVSFGCRIEALLAQGDFGGATALGRAALARYPHDTELLSTACRAARTAHDHPALADLLACAIADQPDQPTPRATAVVEWWQAGERARAFAALDIYLLRFDSNPDTLYQLSTAATALGATPIIEAIRTRALSLGHSVPRFTGNLIESCLISGDVAGLRRLRPALPALTASGDPVLQLWPTVVEAVFQIIDGNALTSGLPLQNLTRQLHLPPVAYGHFVKFLLTAGRPAAAFELLDHALAIYPASPTLNTLMSSARTALAAARENRPSIDLAAPKLLMEEDFFPAAESLLTAHRHAELATLIATHRRASPAWLARRTRDFDWIDLRRALADNDLLTVRAIAQLYLNGDLDRLEQTIALAAQLRDSETIEARETLVQIILRVHPEAKPKLAAVGLVHAVPGSLVGSSAAPARP